MLTSYVHFPGVDPEIKMTYAQALLWFFAVSVAVSAGELAKEQMCRVGQED